MRLIDPTALEGAVRVNGGVGVMACPGCDTAFTPKRRNQKYCTPKCQKATSRNASRGPRTIENAQRTQAHYQRAAWLSHDVLRMSPLRQRQTILLILEAASGHDAALRNILLDPAFLGADRWSPIGKLYPDSKCPTALNIAKMVNAFCHSEWGYGVRDTILDSDVPAYRRFAEAEGPTDPDQSELTYWQAQQAAGKLARPTGPSVKIAGGYDWRLVAKAMGDRGWREYFTTDELDVFL